ncbi:hypothetical protein [Streptomyces acidiscabies]|uniref:Uncharacterized protein n=1 Tax=Streptomyces acidiscabies TaxID=42234 RepID=A0AAP6BJ59_9ACTN|nr:hypothetical protein [Streptomyces acidiscabies]MBP5935442.1 hypothetical protein [Streptomyces sp. LBUM 1476]MBZ3916700.1 hypothetical protein [Streptomyces acidiscabies]MDX2965663.1 hypothetical protein [Streptomyces acidiscabies]MDX3024835.1 hypothetical protein [Streptomyces acidiscabies]MDX3795579.1 hypothetical protein [Streptomyces acidiscabies]
MPLPATTPFQRADDIARHLDRLADHLGQLPAGQALQLVARVMDPDNGVLAGFTGVLVTGSRRAQREAERGTLPAEVWLALGRAANELSDIGLDLGEHTDALREFAHRPASPSASPPAAAPLVVRRHR